MLSAIKSAGSGSKLSVDTNFFRKKTTEILISAMRSARDEKEALIIGKRDLLPSKYTWEEAWIDLVQLYYAGTLEGALQSVAASEGEKAKQAGKELKAVQDSDRILPVSTSDQDDMHNKIGAELDRLDAPAKTPDEDKTDTAKVRDACKQLGIPSYEEKAKKDLVWQLRLRSNAAWRKKVSVERTEALQELMSALKLK